MSSVLSSSYDPGLGAGGGYAGVVQPSQQLTRNPMLPQHPLGAYTDSQFEAQDAMLRNSIARQHADLLQQLGYRDEAGNFIQGSVESEAQKQAQNLDYGQNLAVEGETRKRQAEGTLFSGIRGREQARAEDPFVRSKADLLASTPLTIQQLYERASGLSNDYILGQNQLLSDAAARRAAGLTLAPGGSGAVIPTGVSVGGTPSAITPNPDPYAHTSTGTYDPALGSGSPDASPIIGRFGTEPLGQLPGILGGSLDPTQNYAVTLQSAPPLPLPKTPIVRAL